MGSSGKLIGTHRRHANGRHAIIAIELKILGWATLLGLVHIFATAIVRTRAYGAAWNTGARDATPTDRKTPLVGRLERAQANFFETFPLFAAAVLAAAMAGRLDHATELGCWLYLVARIAYLPLYAAGVPYVRTLVWGLALIGLLHPLWRILAP